MSENSITFGEKKYFGYTMPTIIAYGIMITFVLAVYLDAPGWITYPLSVGWIFLSLLGMAFFAIVMYVMKYGDVKDEDGLTTEKLRKSLYDIETSSKWRIYLHVLINYSLVVWLFNEDWTVTSILWGSSMTVAIASIGTFKGLMYKTLARLEAAEADAK